MFDIMQQPPDARQLLQRIHQLERRVDDLVKPEIPIARGVAVYNDANISIGSGAWTALTFNSERWDDAAFHSTVANTGRLTVPTGYDGWYVISGHVEFASSAAGTKRGLQITLNVGTTVIARVEHADIGAAAVHAISIATLYYLSATDYIQLAAYQDSGGNLNVNAAGNYSPEFRMVHII